SSKKGPFVEERLLEKIQKMNAGGSKQMVRTWSRSSTVFPEMVGHTIAVHHGRKHIPVFISQQMVRHNLRELPPNRHVSRHAVAAKSQWTNGAVRAKMCRQWRVSLASRLARRVPSRYTSAAAA